MTHILYIIYIYMYINTMLIGDNYGNVEIKRDQVGCVCRVIVLVVSE